MFAVRRRIARRWAILFLACFLAATAGDGLAAPAARAQVASDWPTYLHDGQRSGASGDTILSTGNPWRLTKQWSYSTGGVVAASPTVVGGTVYVGSWDGFEYALDAATGALKWKTFLGLTSNQACGTLGVTSAAAVQNGVVYVGGGGPFWYALSANTGQVLWTVYTGDNSATGGHYNWASPLIYNGSAYIGIASDCDTPLVQGQLLRVDLTTHQVVAVFNAVPNGQVGGGIWTSPAVDAATNTIYVTTGTKVSPGLAQGIVALDATSLAVKSFWLLPDAAAVSDSDWGTTPILYTDEYGRPMVAAVNKNGYLYAFSRASLFLGPLWQRLIAVGGIGPEDGGATVASAAFGQGKLFQAGGNTTIGGTFYPGSVRAIDPGTGAIIWEHGSPDVVIAAVAYSNGMVIVGSGATLEVLDASNGNLLFSSTTGGRIYGAPAVANGQIFFGSRDSGVYAYGLSAPTTVGGHAFRLDATPFQSAALTWEGGTNQLGYAVNRQLVSLTLLPATATNYTDTAAWTTPLDCYTLHALGFLGSIGNSDTLCMYPNTRSASNAPPHVGIQLNQSNTATVTWTPASGSPDSYLLWAFPQSAGATPRLQIASSALLSAQDDTQGITTCYVVNAMSNGATIGTSDIMCAIPGQSTLPIVRRQTATASPGSAGTTSASPTATNGPAAQVSPAVRQAIERLQQSDVRGSIQRALAAGPHGAGKGKAQRR